MNYYIFERLTEIEIKLNTLINTPNDYTGDIISALINALAVIIAVIIGGSTIKKKLSQDHYKEKLDNIEENNRQFNQKVTEVILDIPSEIHGPLHYKQVQKFYVERILPLYNSSLNASVEVTTGCYIIERYTNFLLKLRIPHRYPGYKEIRKVAYVDNKYFSYMQNILQLIAFYSRESVRIPNKIIVSKKKMDEIQRKLGGPRDNYERTNVISNLNGINYDPRFNLYYDFYKIICSADDDSIKAFAYAIDRKIVFLTSKYLIENEIYAPLYFRIESDEENYPYLYLSGIRYSHPLGEAKNVKMTLLYVNTINWFYFERNITKQIFAKDNIEYFNKKTDKGFMNLASISSVSSIGHIVKIEISKEKSKDIFTANKRDYTNKIKKLHKG